MNTSVRLNPLAGALLLALSFSAAHAATLTYHGNLQDGGKPANGNYDIRLTLYPGQTGGSALGSPITLYAVPVHDGTFSTEVDFGAAANAGSPAWVAAAVAPAGSGNFTALDSRTPASLDEPSDTCTGDWSLSGNSGNPSGSFLGTTDNQPLQFMVDGQPVGLLWASSTPDQPNIMFGANSISGSVVNGTISGGASNFVSGAGGTIAGGYGNTASGVNSFVAGLNNKAGGFAAVVPGGQNNQALGSDSFAAGLHAVVPSTSAGSFVWSDDQSADDFSATGNDQFLIRARGGAAIGTNDPQGNQLRVVTSGKGISGETSDANAWAVVGSNTGSNGNGGGVFGMSNTFNGFGVYAGSNFGTSLYVAGTGDVSGKVIDTQVGAYLSPGGQWEPNSDRNKKFGFASLDLGSVLDKVLAMPVTTWSYKVEGDSIHHIGPMAQDFYAAFKLGQDDKHIGEVDEGGVAFAAIQGLNQKLEHEVKKIADENATLKAQNASLTAKLAQLDARMTSLEVAQHAMPTARYQVAERGE